MPTAVVTTPLPLRFVASRMIRPATVVGVPEISVVSSARIWLCELPNSMGEVMLDRNSLLQNEDIELGGVELHVPAAVGRETGVVEGTGQPIAPDSPRSG